MDDATTERSTLIRVQTMTCRLAACHLTNGVDEVAVVQIFKPILIQVMGVGAMVEFMSQGIFNSILIMSIL